LFTLASVSSLINEFAASKVCKNWNSAKEWCPFTVCSDGVLTCTPTNNYFNDSSGLYGRWYYNYEFAVGAQPANFKNNLELVTLS
jgi:hypothetical protein